MNPRYQLALETERSLAYAQESAWTRYHREVEPEHILAGLLELGVGEGHSFNLLGVLDLSYKSLRSCLDELLVPHSPYERGSVRETPLSRSSKEIFSAAACFADRDIQPYHVLTGLMMMPQSRASSALADAGATFEQFGRGLRKKGIIPPWKGEPRRW